VQLVGEVERQLQVVVAERFEDAVNHPPDGLHSLGLGQRRAALGGGEHHGHELAEGPAGGEGQVAGPRFDLAGG
jgi:hypothetical protein